LTVVLGNDQAGVHRTWGRCSRCTSPRVDCLAHSTAHL